MGRYTGEGYAGIFPTPWQSGEAATAAPDTDTATTTVRVAAQDKGDDTDGWWAIPGAGAGAVLALALRPFAARLPLGRWRRRREPGPRQELRDV